MPAPRWEQQLQPGVCSVLEKLCSWLVLSRLRNGFAEMGAMCYLKKTKKTQQLLSALLLCLVFIDLQ